MTRRNSGAAPKKGASKKHIKGIVELTRKGTGYLPWPTLAGGEPEKEDIEIFPEKLNGALNGDEVEVELLTIFPRPRGRVVKIVKRARTTFVGTVRGTSVQPADIKFPVAIEINTTHADGDKVLVELLSYDGYRAKGKVIETIGKAGEHRVEMNAIVLEHGFATGFPPEVEREAAELERRHADIIKAELPKRADFRDRLTMTIDPKDAKDFDDALSVRELPDGNFEIGVHIADASYFCAPGTAIDAEAAKRGTSVYLVDATIPMLPHSLSSGIASLKPNEDRLAFSAMFTLDKNANVLERYFTKSVINSKKRFTYEEAQEILDAAKPAPNPLTSFGTTQPGSASAQMATQARSVARPQAASETVPQELMTHSLLTLYRLAKIMRSQREKEGAIDFGDNEVRFELDQDGKPLKVIRKKRIDTNWLIEEFMLLANREVASHISELAKKVPEKNFIFLYRIHDEPKQDRIEELATFVRAIGYNFAHAFDGKKKKTPSAKDIQKLLKEIAGKPEEHLIRTATLRSMAKAIYSTKNIGHFGLAFRYYTHFTSPIRRYPDILVHRILASHLEGNPITRREYVDLEKRCIRASEQEAKATDAERESIRYKLVEYMQERVGQTFDATISGVTDWGIYVEDVETSAEGLVRVKALSDDYYHYSPKEYALIGQRNKKKYTLGNKVRVKLVAADLAARTLDFELA
jgi:ribonuclease R